MATLWLDLLADRVSLVARAAWPCTVLRAKRVRSATPDNSARMAPKAALDTQDAPDELAIQVQLATPANRVPLVWLAFPANRVIAATLDLMDELAIWALAAQSVILDLKVYIVYPFFMLLKG